ncbi:hypothetical protein NQ318_006648 [Aromia moschata]|uniref:DUF4817 domain-containing protein n=1 Tax=Aromia moschata TaxID=1265417 RepID=A0AAV8YSZ6_9CUCU|nr:hypothetical protein NQ318_006648 [Aromia moschata]
MNNIRARITSRFAGQMGIIGKLRNSTVLIRQRFFTEPNLIKYRHYIPEYNGIYPELRQVIQNAVSGKYGELEFEQKTFIYYAKNANENEAIINRFRCSKVDNGCIQLKHMHFTYGCANSNALKAQRIYSEQYPERRLPHHTTFTNIHQRLWEFRKFEKKKREVMTLAVPEKSELKLWKKPYLILSKNHQKLVPGK